MAIVLCIKELPEYLNKKPFFFSQVVTNNNKATCYQVALFSWFKKYAGVDVRESNTTSHFTE